MTAFEIGIALATAFVQTATAAMAVAGRSLGRLQRRDWATGGLASAAEDDESAAVAVETLFIVLGLARQLSLLALSIQAALHVSRLVPAAPVTAAVGVAALLYLLFDKLLPYWLVATIGGGQLLRWGRPLLHVERLVLAPLARVLSRTLGIARARNLRDNGEPSAGVLGAFLDMAEEEGLVSESEEALLRGVVDFEDTIAREVMTPRVDIMAIDATATLGEMRALIAEHRLSRIPVIADDLDHVVGVANLKDLVAALNEEGDQGPVTRIVRPAWFVPETKRVSELLQEFQRRREQLTIIVDEYGGTAGLVTLEDVLEEIVGEIQDEDEPEEVLVEIGPDGVIVSGKAEIEEVEEALGRGVQAGEYHTVGGMVFSLLGRVPAAGESFDCAGLRFEVLDADERRIHRVRISAG